MPRRDEDADDEPEDAVATVRQAFGRLDDVDGLPSGALSDLREAFGPGESAETIRRNIERIRADEDRREAVLSALVDLREARREQLSDEVEADDELPEDAPALAALQDLRAIVLENSDVADGDSDGEGRAFGFRALDTRLARRHDVAEPPTEVSDLPAAAGRGEHVVVESDERARALLRGATRHLDTFRRVATRLERYHESLSPMHRDKSTDVTPPYRELREAIADLETHLGRTADDTHVRHAVGAVADTPRGGRSRAARTNRRRKLRGLVADLDRATPQSVRSTDVEEALRFLELVAKGRDPGRLDYIYGRIHA